MNNYPPEASTGQPQGIQRTVLTTTEAAAYLGLAISTLNKWRCYGDGPQFIKLGRAVRYTRDDLDDFVEIGRRGPAGSRPSNRARREVDLK